MHVLELTWSMDQEAVSLGVDDSPDTPLARATQCLFREGKPFARLNKCFFWGPDDVVRWLGVFVHSAGNRVIFFPGFAQMHSDIRAYNENLIRWDQPFCIDHLSLEPDWQSWHFTEPRSTAHVGKMYTRQLAPGVFHWFSMSVKSRQDLRVVQKETKVTAPTPERDMERRLEVFRASREDVVFQLVSLNEDHYTLEPNFLHFSVVIGPPGFASPGSDVLGAPYGSPMVSSHGGPPIIGIPSRAHRVQLSETVELEITSCVLPGDLQNRLVFSALSSASRSS